jgi:hypothetical protein
MNKVLEELRKRREVQAKKVKDSGYDFEKIQAAYDDLVKISHKINHKCWSIVKKCLDDGADVEDYLYEGTVPGKLVKKYAKILIMHNDLLAIDKEIALVEGIVKETSETISKHSGIIF